MKVMAFSLYISSGSYSGQTSWMSISIKPGPEIRCLFCGQSGARFFWGFSDQRHCLPSFPLWTGIRNFLNLKVHPCCCKWQNVILFLRLSNIPLYTDHIFFIHSSTVCHSDLIKRPETIKILEGNTGENLLDIGAGNNFLDMTPKAQATTAKN